MTFALAGQVLMRDFLLLGLIIIISIVFVVDIINIMVNIITIINIIIITSISIINTVVETLQAQTRLLENETTFSSVLLFINDIIPPQEKMVSQAAGEEVFRDGLLDNLEEEFNSFDELEKLTAPPRMG